MSVRVNSKSSLSDSNRRAVNTKKGDIENASPSKRRVVNSEQPVSEYDSFSEEYDRCDEFGSKYALRNKVNEMKQQLSPMKRNNQQRHNNDSVMSFDESPKKRQRLPVEVVQASSRTPKFMSKGSVSLCLQAERKHSSTPKSERRVNLKSRLENLNNSEAIEKNRSNNWGDILEELEVQTKELNEYVEKVTLKYKIDKEKLMKSTESDAECLRKRQKQINFGKVTPEYQRYIAAVDKHKREVYHPRTPNKFRRCSRRKFDGLVKKWRKALHVWDENPEALKDFKFSIADSDEMNKDLTDDFGCTSKIDGSVVSYNIDDYDILDVEVEENDLEAS